MSSNFPENTACISPAGAPVGAPAISFIVVWAASGFSGDAGISRQEASCECSGTSHSVWAGSGPWTGRT